MTRHYLFFTRNSLPQPRADLVQVTNSANAAANLGYSTVLAYLNEQANPLNPLSWVSPFHPQKPDPTLAQFYNLGDRLTVSPLPIPYPIGRVKTKWTDVSTLVCKYHLPFHLRPVTQLVHSRDWNFVKAALKSGIPAIYEHHHHEEKQFELEFVTHPLFQIAVTVADPVRDSMIAGGMPSDKVVKIHNGFNQRLATRHPQAAFEWRQRLLAPDYTHVVVYAGGLNPFKGVDLLVDVAKALPDTHVVLAGGDAAKVEAYQALARLKQVPNITFLGHLPHEQLASLLQSANIVVHPHCSGKEATFTSPLKFFDYMASGTPIVATEIPPLMEFKSSGVVAGWCEPDHPQPLITCLQQVLISHPYRPEGYTDSVEFVQQFSWENRIEKILSFVEPSKRPQTKMSS